MSTSIQSQPGVAGRGMSTSALGRGGGGVHPSTQRAQPPPSQQRQQQGRHLPLSGVVPSELWTRADRVYFCPPSDIAMKGPRDYGHGTAPDGKHLAHHCHGTWTSDDDVGAGIQGGAGSRNLTMQDTMGTHSPAVVAKPILNDDQRQLQQRDIYAEQGAAVDARWSARGQKNNNSGGDENTAAPSRSSTTTATTTTTSRYTSSRHRQQADDDLERKPSFSSSSYQQIEQEHYRQQKQPLPAGAASSAGQSNRHGQAYFVGTGGGGVSQVQTSAYQHYGVPHAFKGHYETDMNYYAHHLHPGLGAAHSQQLPTTGQQQRGTGLGHGVTSGQTASAGALPPPPPPILISSVAVGEQQTSLGCKLSSAGASAAAGAGSASGSRTPFATGSEYAPEYGLGALPTPGHGHGLPTASK